MIADITWRPGIGDPTWLAWIITLAYGVASGLCCRCGLPRRAPRTWLVIAGLLLLLGLNKQLDLQTLFIEVGREIAVATGWYGERRRVQLIFVLVLAVALIGALLTLIWKRRRFFLQHPLTLAGSGLLVLFVLLRAGSMDHVDEAMGIQLDNRRWIAAMELGGVLCFAVAAGRSSDPPP